MADKTRLKSDAYKTQIWQKSDIRWRKKTGIKTMGAGALVGLGTEYFCCIIFTTARSYALYVVLRAKHYSYLSKILYNFPPAFFIWHVQHPFAAYPVAHTALARPHTSSPQCPPLCHCMARLLSPYVYPASLRSYTSGGWGHSGTGVWCAIEANNLCTLLKFTNGDDRTKKILQILAFANGFQPLKRST